MNTIPVFSKLSEDDISRLASEKSGMPENDVKRSISIMDFESFTFMY